MTPIDAGLLTRMPLPDHARDADKDARGAILAIGGSAEVPGAILLAAVAALRAGAGKLQIATSARVAVTLGLMVPEALVVGLDETAAGGIAASAIDVLGPRLDRADAVVFGPGMADADAVAALTEAILAHPSRPPLVLDAAALERLDPAAVAARGECVLTPHAGEMATLLGIDRDAVVAEPERVAVDAAARFGAVVAMKGGATVVATPDGATFRYGGGGIGLATSGSGDTLAGIIGGLLARGADPLTATVWGVYLHGEAGKRLAERCGRIGFLARELLAEVPRVMHERCRG